MEAATGDHTGVDEGAWILDPEPATTGRDSVPAEKSLRCTGSQDRRSPSFEFDNACITIRDHVWIAARATVLRGVTVGDGATVAACDRGHRRGGGRYSPLATAAVHSRAFLDRMKTAGIVEHYAPPDLSSDRTTKRARQTNRR